MKKQRDALLEMTWLDLPAEPCESIEEWKRLFSEGWIRRNVSDEYLSSAMQDLRLAEGRRDGMALDMPVPRKGLMPNME